MNQRQIARLEMLQATDTYLNECATTWNNIPIINRYKTELSQYIEQIKTAASDQDAAQIYIGKTLRQLKKQVAVKMDIQDDILEAYADDTGNAELLAQATNAQSDYFRLSNENFETKVKNIITLIETHQAQMTDYGSSPEQLADVKQDFDLFLERRGKPRAYRIASRIATQNLEELFTEAGALLEKLDKVTKRFKRSNVSFFNGYTAARQIIDR